MSAAAALLDNTICNGGFSPLACQSRLTGHAPIADIN